MAAITTIVNGTTETLRVRTATAQATTGQTDWVAVPRWAKYAIFVFNLTAVAGTTPIFTPKILVTDPITRIDTGVGTLKLGEHTAFTGLTAAGTLWVQAGPGVTGIADDVTNSATVVSFASLNVVLPPIVGLVCTNDRADADETYTYTVTAIFRGV